MKLTVTSLLLLLTFNASAQTDSAFVPKLTVKWAPAGLVAGNIALQGEYNFGGRQSLTVKLGFPNNTTRTLEYDDKDARFDMKAMSFLAGYRMYFSKSKVMKGMYWEPFFHYVHHSSEGLSNGMLYYRPANMRFTNDYNAAGVGVQLGVQFLVAKRFIVDVFFLGPQISSASNNLKVSEYGNILPWTPEEKKEVEEEVKEFVQKFRFIRDRTTITPDWDNKTLTADFKGPLPGVRAGISFGVAF